ncbi:MAG: ABC transporter substrate-binding protein [Castellaniella sp.]|uniref:ABC transporter substrate-binding protein n=1 Tax=Castellaniella sp. TaxID=1955812 RepID=UPI0011FF6F64|nr:ABC transporter substrate-binding protein [Castellaniella sp.]TAN29125.1 MAG: ABC transporter substrate-binding protein [Castellaniella sp.]
MDRRKFLGTVGSAALTAPLFGRTAFAATDKVTFGIPLPMSGPFAANGKFGAMGAQLYVEDLKTLLGHPLAYTVLDAQGQPAAGVRKVQDLFQQQGAHYFAGASLSSVALALGGALDKLGGVFVTAAGADEITGTHCNKAMFRWSVPTYGAVQETIGPLLKRYPDAKRWYTITPQYVFGESLLKATKDLLKANGRELVGNSYHSLDEREFSGYVINAMSTKPDVLVLLNFSSQSSETLRQAVSFGVKKKAVIVMVWASGLEQFQSLGADLCEGVYFGAQYWHQIDSPGNKRLVEITKKKFTMNPNYSLAQIYVACQMMGEGIKKAGSIDPKKAIAAMEGLTYEGLTGTETIRAGDHQVLKNYYLLRGKAKSAMKDPDDYCDILSSGQSYLSPEQEGCKMPA